MPNAQTILTQFYSVKPLKSAWFRNFGNGKLGSFCFFTNRLYKARL